MSTAEKPKQEAKKTETLFSKEQILGASQFVNRRDLLVAILDDGKQYTLAGVQKEIDKFLGKKVNA